MKGEYSFVPRVPHDYIGTYHPRNDGLAKAAGLAEFADDATSLTRFPRQAYMRILKSPYPNARIRQIDTSEAEKLSGFLGILRYDDPEIVALPQTSDAWSDAVNTLDAKRGWTSGALDRRILGQRAYWVGDEVGAAVAADSIETAEEAIRLLKVDWEVLPFALSVEDALMPDAPVIHPEVNPNGNEVLPADFWGPEVFVDRGDVSKAFSDADVVVETKTSYGNATECAMDYWSVLADWTEDMLTVISNSYGVDQTRMHLHAMLSLPMNKVRVITPYEGGSHGRGNTGDQQFFILAALMSKKIGRPVKYRQNRVEHFHTTRTKQLAKVKIGAKKDGTITAISTEVMADSGAFFLLCGGSVKGVPGEWAECFLGQIPNVRMSGRVVYTNIIPSSCMRSIGNIQINFHVGEALDALAEKLCMDPVVIAEKNFSNEMEPTPNASLEAVVRAGAKAIGWEKRHEANADIWYDKTKKRGMGFSCNNTWHTEAQEYRRGEAQVKIKLNPDGSVILDAPTVETGVGTNTCAQLACAEGLGVLPERISWIHRQDTQTGLKDQVQTDSGASGGLTESAFECAVRLKKRFLAQVAKKMDCEADALDMKEGRVFVKAHPETGMSIEQYYDELDLNTEGTLVPLVELYSRRYTDKNYGHAYMATFAEVEVDTETGEVKILKIAISSDGGTVLYPTGAEGQLIGGQCIGVGEGIFETMVYDEKTGIPLNFNFIDYKFPTIEDIPPVEPLPVEVYRGGGNFGSIGMGEGAPCCTPRAIANAVYNAVGIRINETPITPFKVLKALKKEEE